VNLSADGELSLQPVGSFIRGLQASQIGEKTKLQFFGFRSEFPKIPPGFGGLSVYKCRTSADYCNRHACCRFESLIANSPYWLTWSSSKDLYANAKTLDEGRTPPLFTLNDANL
jgi:hypothetical protein